MAITAAERAHTVGEAEKAAAYLESLRIAEIAEVHPSWLRAAAMLARKMGKIDLAWSVAITLAIPRFDRSSMAQIEMSDLFREIVETSFLAVAFAEELNRSTTQHFALST